MKFSIKSALIGATVLSQNPVMRAEAHYVERFRPQFHFTSTTDWLNDPNGLVFFDGEYHLCFQRVPGSNDGNTARKSWGNAVSTDLVHWQQLPNDAIAPDEAGSIWSGSAVVDWNNSSGFGSAGRPPLVAAYTNAKDPFDQRLAYSTDRGRSWTKFGKTILPNITGHNRDPKLIWHEPSKRWILALYLDQPHRFALFASADLKAWTKVQELTLDGDDECPDFFPLNLDGDPTKEKWIFTAANGRYVVGAFDGKTFTLESDSLPGDEGTGAFYAAQTFSDIPTTDGRRIQIGWLRDGKYPGMPFNQQLAFPCELTLRSTPRGPRLFKWPVREIASLYAEKREWHDADLRPGKDLLDGLNGDLFDISAEIAPGDAPSFTLNIRGQPITFHAEGKAGGSVTAWDRRVSLSPIGGRIKLRVLVDRTSIEIFANDGATVMSGCFLPADGERAISLVSEGGTARVVSIVAHALRSVWPIGSTTTQLAPSGPSLRTRGEVRRGASE